MMVMTSNSHCWSPGSIRREVKIILLLPWNWHVETMGERDQESADSCRMGEVEGVGTVELVCIGRLLRMGCDSFIMPMCGSVASGKPGSRMGYHGSILLRTKGRRWGRDRMPNSVRGNGRGRDRKSGGSQVDSPELPQMPEITEMTENFTKVTKFKKTLINYVWENLKSKGSKKFFFRGSRVFEYVLWQKTKTRKCRK